MHIISSSVFLLSPHCWFFLKTFSSLFSLLWAAVLMVCFSILFNTCKTLKSWVQTVLVLLPHEWAALCSRSALPKGWPLLHSSIYYPWQSRNSMNSNSGVWDYALSPTLLWSSCLLIITWSFGNWSYFPNGDTFALTAGTWKSRTFLGMLSTSHHLIYLHSTFLFPKDFLWVHSCKTLRTVYLFSPLLTDLK